MQTETETPRKQATAKTIHQKADGSCRCGRTPVVGDATEMEHTKVVACAGCSLNCLTRTITASESFEDLLKTGSRYTPTIYPHAEQHERLRAAYDRAQADRGDSRRCHPAAVQS